jgi:hypothetical protein
MKNELLPIQPGVRVRVSDGTPQPPARFKRKLADWENKNFDAVVVGEEAPNQWRQDPVYRLQFGDLSKRAWLVMVTSRPASMVTALEDAPSYEVEKHGIDAVIKGLTPGARA